MRSIFSQNILFQLQKALKGIKVWTDELKGGWWGNTEKSGKIKTLRNDQTCVQVLLSTKYSSLQESKTPRIGMSCESTKMWTGSSRNGLRSCKVTNVITRDIRDEYSFYIKPRKWIPECFALMRRSKTWIWWCSSRNTLRCENHRRLQLIFYDGGYLGEKKGTSEAKNVDRFLKEQARIWEP